MSEREVNKYEKFVNDYLQYSYFILTSLNKFSLFSLYENSLKYDISINKIVSAINYLVKIISKIVNFNIENEHETVSELLNNDELNNVKENLLNFLKRYSENKSQNDLNCEKILKLYNKCVDLRQFTNEILSLEEWYHISNYLESIVNNNKIEEINRVCHLIDNSPNGIDRNLVDNLLQLFSKCEKSQQLMRLMGLIIKQKMELGETLGLIEQIPPQKNPHEQQENTTQTKPVPPQENSHEHQK